MVSILYDIIYPHAREHIAMTSPKCTRFLLVVQVNTATSGCMLE